MNAKVGSHNSYCTQDSTYASGIVSGSGRCRYDQRPAPASEKEYSPKVHCGLWISWHGKERGSVVPHRTI